MVMKNLDYRAYYEYIMKTNWSDMFYKKLPLSPPTAYTSQLSTREQMRLVPTLAYNSKESKAISF